MRLTLLELIFGGLALFLLVLVMVLSWQGRSLKRDNATLSRDNSLYLAANADNVRAIADLKRANVAWSDRCRLQPGASDTALAELDRKLAKARAELVAARANREVIYATDPSARSWRDGSLPAAVADSLFPQ